MAITLKQITGKIVIPGTTTGIRATVTATPMTDSQALTFPAEDVISWGPVVGVTDVAGNLPPTFKIPTNSEQQTQLVWKFVIEPVDKHAGLPKSWVMGYYTITGTGTINLADLIELDVSAINTSTLVTIQAYIESASASATTAAGSATSAAASASLAQTLVTSDLGTTDGQTWALLTDPNSQSGGHIEATYGHKNEVILATDFGAIADWDGYTGTDNTLALQNALDAIDTEQGGTLDLGLGQYLVGGTLTPKPGTRIVGRGHIGSYEATGSSRSAAITKNTAGVLIDLDPGTTVDQRGIALENLTLDGASRTDNTLLRIFNTNRCRIKNVTFKNAGIGIGGDSGTPAIVGGDCSWHQIEGCTFALLGTGIKDLGGGGPSGILLGGDFNGCDVGLDLGGRTAQLRIIGVKFDSGGIINNGHANQIIACAFERCDPAITIGGDPAIYPAPPAGDGNIIDGCNFTGNTGLEASIVITSDARNTMIGQNRYSNVAQPYVDDSSVSTYMRSQASGRFGSEVASVIAGNIGTADTIYYRAAGTAPTIGMVIESRSAPIYFNSGATTLGYFDQNYGLTIPGGAYNSRHLTLGNYHLWVDATGALRIKSGAPASDTDGAVVGTQA